MRIKKSGTHKVIAIFSILYSGWMKEHNNRNYHIVSRPMFCVLYQTTTTKRCWMTKKQPQRLLWIAKSRKFHIKSSMAFLFKVKNIKIIISNTKSTIFSYLIYIVSLSLALPATPSSRYRFIIVVFFFLWFIRDFLNIDKCRRKKEHIKI